MNPLQNKLLDKLQKQNEQAGFDTSEDALLHAQSVAPPVDEPNLQTSIPPTEAAGVVQSPIPATITQQTPELGESYPAHPEAFVKDISQEESQSANTPESRKERIMMLERALEGSPTNEKNVTPKAKTYLDDFGAETYYVKNISNGHVSVSDLDITIKRGKSEDLLKFAELEDTKKSRDLRAAVGYDKNPGPYNKTLLLRLTPEEYEIEKIKELKNKQKIDQFKQNQADIHTQQQIQQQQQSQTYNAVTQQKIVQPQTPRIRPTVLSKLEKLRLSSMPENAHLGLAPEEFVEWAITEHLSIEELDFIISHPNVINNSNIRTALYEKRSEVT
jgi:hypothetical protein